MNYNIDITYKIKILCTSEGELSHNNNPICNPKSKKISENDYDKLIDQLKKLVNNNNYINSALILHKKFDNFKIKTLEFLCNNEIIDDDFKCFIQNMHDIGFYSKYDTKIEFLKLVTETINESVNKSVTRIHNYKFQSKTKKIEKEHKNKNKNKNKSTYHTEILYKK